MRFDPAHSIIKRLGGEDVVREVTGAGETAPYRWQHAREKGGTGGIIPHKHAVKLLAYATERQIDVTPADFLAAPTLAEAATSRSAA
jgi:hypothetical protein